MRWKQSNGRARRHHHHTPGTCIGKSPFNNELLDSDVQSLTQWTTRAANALGILKIKTVRDLIAINKRQLRHIPNLGKKSLREIENALSRHGLRLD
jgi:DNA-directed RNA polymerase alpha subunit